MLRRRGFLLAAGGAVVVATAWAWRILTRGDGDGAPPQLAPYPGHGSIFPLETRPLLDALADAIVPRWGGHPAASEIGIASRLERWLLTSPLRSKVYRTYWPGFEAWIREHVALQPGRPDPDALVLLLRGWYAEYRDAAQPSANARFAEDFRRDVLRLYYTSPAGWKSVGYDGPVHRSHPRVRTSAGHAGGAGS